MISPISNLVSDIAPGTGDFLLFDGDCPFCAAFVKMQRLRAAGVNLKLIDAREQPELVASFFQKGLDINDGMIMRVGDTIYFGGDVLHMVALMTGPAGPLNRVLAKAFANRSVARFVYPALRAGRNASIAVLGRKKIIQSRQSKNS